VDAIEAVAAKYAADWPACGHRKIAAMMRADGHQVSTSTAPPEPVNISETPSRVVY
jgi:hypothetical protein